MVRNWSLFGLGHNMAINWSIIGQNLDLVRNWSKHGGPALGTSTKHCFGFYLQRRSMKAVFCLSVRLSCLSVAIVKRTLRAFSKDTESFPNNREVLPGSWNFTSREPEDFPGSGCPFPGFWVLLKLASLAPEMLRGCKKFHFPGAWSPPGKWPSISRFLSFAKIGLSGPQNASWMLGISLPRSLISRVAPSHFPDFEFC